MYPSYYTYEILREGNTLSQIHSKFFCIFLKLELERVDPVLGISVWQRKCLSITLPPFVVVHCRLPPEFCTPILGPVRLEECDPTPVVAHLDSD